MDIREERGRLLSLDKRIKHVEGCMWFVPSQTEGGKGYLVNLLAVTCTCDDYELRKGKCKHMWAVEFHRAAAAGAAPVEAVKVKRPTYKQDWPRYNAAQCVEKAMVQGLLRGLCDGIQSPPYSGKGRPPIPLGDAVYGVVLKVYTTFSARRASTDIRESADAGRLCHALHFNSISNYLEKPELTPLLKALIEDSAAPLACVEDSFAIDSTGFGTSTYRRWYDHKYEREMSETVWLKLHAMVGTVTNVITSANVTDSDGADSPEMPGLIVSTGKKFKIGEVSGDKAYLSHANLKAIEDAGGVPYVPFKSNSKSRGSAAWRRMWAMFMLKQEEFLAHYHQRSNVEATFSALKRKFGGSVRSKIHPAQVNEVLCKVLCYNLACVVHAIHELGLEPPQFGASGAREVAA